MLSREVEDLVAPHETTTAIVHDWLASHDVDLGSISYSPAKDWITLRIPLSKVESMLSTKYHTYRHSSTDELAVRTLSYSLPRDLHAHIDVIQPTTMFDRMRKMRATYILQNDRPVQVDDANLPAVKGPAGQDIPASCNTTITPTCLQALYRTAGYVPQAAKKGNQIGVNGFLEQACTFIRPL